jgi:hypothetical protein
MKAEIVDGVLHLYVEHKDESAPAEEFLQRYELHDSEISLYIPPECMIDGMVPIH